jgi:hypothetical protein
MKSIAVVAFSSSRPPALTALPEAPAVFDGKSGATALHSALGVMSWRADLT